MLKKETQKKKRPHPPPGSKGRKRGKSLPARKGEA